MKNSSSYFDEFIPTIRQVDNGSIIFLKTFIFRSGMEKRLDIIESCGVAFLHHVNGNNVQTLLPSNQFSKEEIYKSVFNIYVRLQ